MRPVVVLGSPASCGDLATGSAKVTAFGLGITRVGLDIAGSLIIGPGNPRVLVEGLPISLVGDGVVGHGDGSHSAPIMTSIQAKVFSEV